MRAYKLKKCKRIHGIDFAPDGTRLLVVGGEVADVVSAVLWLDVATGEVARWPEQLAGLYAVTPNLTKLILGGADQYDEGPPLQWAALPDGAEWRPMRARTGNKAAPLLASHHLFGMAIDTAGERLAVGHGQQFHRGGDGHEWEIAVTVTRIDPVEVVVTFTPADAIGVLAFSPDGSRLAVSGGPEGNPPVEVFDLPTGTLHWRYNPPGTRTRRLAFAPDGRLAVANARNVYVLPLDKPEPLQTLSGHKGQVNAVAYTRDGRRVLTASQDGAIRVWDAGTGQHLTSFDWGVGPVSAVAFAPDGLTCAAGSLNGQVVVWDVDA